MHQILHGHMSKISKKYYVNIFNKTLLQLAQGTDITLGRSEIRVRILYCVLVVETEPFDLFRCSITVGGDFPSHYLYKYNRNCVRLFYG